MKERSFGAILAPYLDDPSTFFVVSSDFCHWGSRFSYTYYQPRPSSESDPLPNGYPISKSSQKPTNEHPIHKAIELLDRTGMNHIAFPESPTAVGGKSKSTDVTTGKKASDAHAAFASYLKATKNTICGRHPIGVLLGALAELEQKEEWRSARLQWVRYEQSSAAKSLSDSSVSYASAFVCK